MKPYRETIVSASFWLIQNTLEQAKQIPSDDQFTRNILYSRVETALRVLRTLKDPQNTSPEDMSIWFSGTVWLMRGTLQNAQNLDITEYSTMDPLAIRMDLCLKTLRSILEGRLKSQMKK